MTLRTPLPSIFPSVALLAALAACGPSGASSGSEGGGGSGGSDAGGSVGDGDTAGTAGTAGPGECPVPEDEPAPPQAPTTIVVRNTTDAVQYVMPISLACTSELVGLTVDGIGQDLSFSGRPPMACRDFGGAPNPAGFCSGCSDASYPGMALAPGAELEIPWDGFVWSGTRLEGEACTYDELCLPYGLGGAGNASCQVRRVVAPGTPITVRAEVTSECPADAPETCACASGTCPISVYDLDAPPPEQTLEVDGVAGTDVEIVIAP